MEQENKIFRRHLPDFYFDPAYVDKDALKFLETTGAMLEEMHKELKQIWQNKMFHTCRHLWALDDHQKMWDLLEIMPEKEIFRAWLEKKKKALSIDPIHIALQESVDKYAPVTLEDVEKVHRYLSTLYVERLAKMMTLLSQGMGHPESFKNIFEAFFYYKDVPEIYSLCEEPTNSGKITYIYRLRLQHDSKMEVTLKISEPLTVEETKDASTFDHSEFNKAEFDKQGSKHSIPGFTLTVASNFTSFHVLPDVKDKKGQAILSPETRKELTQSAQELYSMHGKYYFEKLVKMATAAGVQGRIYYTTPILVEKGTLQYKDELSWYSITQELSEAKSPLEWIPARFNTSRFNESVWGGPEVVIRITQDISEERKIEEKETQSIECTIHQDIKEKNSPQYKDWRFDCSIQQELCESKPPFQDDLIIPLFNYGKFNQSLWG